MATDVAFRGFFNIRSALSSRSVSLLPNLLARTTGFTFRSEREVFVLSDATGSCGEYVRNLR